MLPAGGSLRPLLRAALSQGASSSNSGTCAALQHFTHIVTISNHNSCGEDPQQNAAVAATTSNYHQQTRHINNSSNMNNNTGGTIGNNTNRRKGISHAYSAPGSPSRVQRKSTMTLQYGSTLAMPANSEENYIRRPIPTSIKQERNNNQQEMPWRETVVGINDINKDESEILYQDEGVSDSSHVDTATVERVQEARTTPRIIPRTADPYCNEHLHPLDAQRFRGDPLQVGSTHPLSQYSAKRKVTTKILSKYMQLITPESGNMDTKTEGGPLAIVYPWLMAQPKHVSKYTKLYTDLGISVLLVSISPLDLLMPVPRSHVAAVEMLEYLLANPQHDNILIHGMSVGAYGFMEVMTKMEQNESRYLGIRPRFIGQVWDSPCDLPGLKEGVARSVSKDRNTQELIMRGLDWFLEVRYDAATCHYIKTQDMYHKNYCNSSSLFLYSRADPVSVPFINTNLCNNWYSMGFQVHSKVFNESQHVGHLAKYRDEYYSHIMAYMNEIGMLRAAGIELDH